MGLTQLQVAHAGLLKARTAPIQAVVQSSLDAVRRMLVESKGAACMDE